MREYKIKQLPLFNTLSPTLSRGERELTGQQWYSLATSHVRNGSFAKFASNLNGIGRKL